MVHRQRLGFHSSSFRGPNTRPQATGSELVIGDVLSAVDSARANARIDESRIYAVSWSGGGFLGLAANECRKRSPLTYLERARDIPIDINHGIRYGRNNGDPVPISQSMRAFNLLAAPQDRLTDEEIEYFTREAQVPTTLRSEVTDASYGGLRVLFRRQSGNARITVFDGAHDKNTEAAFRWLNRQRNGR